MDSTLYKALDTIPCYNIILLELRATPVRIRVGPFCSSPEPPTSILRPPNCSHKVYLLLLCCNKAFQATLKTTVKARSLRELSTWPRVRCQRGSITGVSEEGCSNGLSILQLMCRDACCFHRIDKPSVYYGRCCRNRKSLASMLHEFHQQLRNFKSTLQWFDGWTDQALILVVFRRPSKCAVVK